MRLENLEKADELYKKRMFKKFELEDQPQWKKICDPIETGSSSKGLTLTMLRKVEKLHMGVGGLKGGMPQKERVNKRQTTPLWRW